MVQADDVRELIFLQGETGVFSRYFMDAEFGVLATNSEQNYWYKGESYRIIEEWRHYDNEMRELIHSSPEVHARLSHDVLKIFNQDRQFACYAVLKPKSEAADVASEPELMYCFKEFRGSYKRCSLNRDETYTFQFGEKEYVLDIKDTEEPVSVEKEENSTGCFSSLLGFFRKNKEPKLSSSSSGSALEGSSRSQSSPHLFR